MTLRCVRTEELGQLVELCIEHAAYEGVEVWADGQEERLAAAIESRRLAVWVVEDRGRLAGFAAASVEVSTWWAESYVHLDCLYLRPEARRRGWGGLLLDAVLEHARAVGCAQVQWQTPPWNEDAIAFYEARGARSRPKLRFNLELSRDGSPAVAPSSSRSGHHRTG